MNSVARFNTKSFFAFFFYVVTGLFLILQSYNEELRYLKYFLPLVLLIVYVPTTTLKRKIELDDFLVQQIKLYAVLIVWSIVVLIFRGFTVRFFQEIYFVLSPLLTLLILQQVTDFKSLEKKIAVIFYMLVVADIIFTGTNFFADLVDLVGSLPDALLTSASSTESPYAFDFGLFAIYFFVKKKKVNCLVALIFTVISFKRIALLGVIVALVTFFLLRRSYQKQNRHRLILWMVTIANVFLVVNLYLFTIGKYDELIETNLGVSANFLSQGRYELYQGIFEQVHLSTLFSGLGLGSITDYLTINQAFLLNLHSDILKVFIEFGSLFFVYWIYQFFRKTSKRIELLILSLYLNIMFLTDNVFIYFDVMMFYYLFVVLLKFDRQQEEAIIQVPTYHD